MIISLRGTHGAGKSTIVRALIDQFAQQRFYGRAGKGRPEAYALAIPGVSRTVYVLGPYETPCGGCDALHPYDLILDMMAEYGVRGHVLLEGALVSSAYGRLGRMMEQCGQEGVMAFMGTPMDECIRRIVQRRLDRGDLRPLATANTERKQHQIMLGRLQIAKHGILRAVELPVDREAETLIALLQGAAHALPERLDYEKRTIAPNQSQRDAAPLDGRPDFEQIPLL